jgi:hypothetical protein
MSDGKPAYSHVLSERQLQDRYTAGQLARDVEGNCVETRWATRPGRDAGAAQGKARAVLAEVVGIAARQSSYYH